MLGRAFPSLPQSGKNAIIQAALESGINWFDTAEIYGGGVSERSLAAGLKAAGKKPGDVVIATKWFPFLRRAGHMRRSIHDRLRCLEGYPVDLYYIHQPFSLSSPEDEMEVMVDLIESGLIRAAGISNYGPDRMRRAHAALLKRGYHLAANQVEYSLLNRKIETDGTLETARELGVSIVAYTPLASGLLSGKYHRQPGLLSHKMFYWRRRIQSHIEPSRPVVQALEEIASEYKATPSQVALNWLINFHGSLVVTIPGATRPSQAAENAAAMTFTLTPAEMARLDELTRSFR